LFSSALISFCVNCSTSIVVVFIIVDFDRGGIWFCFSQRKKNDFGVWRKDPMKNTMNCFPLYETLFHETTTLRTLPFPQEDQQYIFRHVAQLDEYGREMFYAIIRQDHVLMTIREHASPPVHLPPSCRQLKSGLRIDFDKVPNHVKYMLREFIQRHLKKIHEDVLFFKRE
jgi:hypothetical protein